MAEAAEVVAAEVNPCSNPGCDQPGTKSCNACKTAFYCGVNCQTGDWTHHKEECDAHLRKVGKANLAKASRFHEQHNWAQTLRYGEIAATKLKKLKDRRLETVEDISLALGRKYDALGMMGRYKEGMECAEEEYTLWAMNHMRNPGSLIAAFALIQSCLLNHEYEDAEHYARHAMFMINEMTDNFIPPERRSQFLADGSYFLARAIHELAVRAGGNKPEDEQKAGEEAIALARQALKLRTQLYGKESNQVAAAMVTLADVLDYSNDVDNDEVPRFYEQAIEKISPLEGALSPNIASCENKQRTSYQRRARRAQAANDLERCLTNLESALSHFREALRIDRANNHAGGPHAALFNIARTEEMIRATRAAAEATAAATTATAAATKN